MKFTVTKTPFLAELTRLQGVVEKRSTIPVISNILMESSGMTDLRMIGTDLDVSFTTECPAEIKEPGAICIPSKKLYEIVRSLPDTDIEFTVDGEHVAIKCQKSRFKLTGIGKDAFPEVKQPEGSGVRINGTLWAEAVRRTIFASTADESRYALQAIRTEIGNGKMIMVATDGHRLAYVEAAGEYGPDAHVLLIPRKAMIESAKLAVDGDFQIVADAGHICFVSGKRTLTSRLASGQFPNYEMVIPKDHDKKAIVDAALFASALRRCSLVADERSHAVRLEFAEGQLTVSAQSAEAGEGQDTIAVDYGGPDVAAGFNAAYLLDFATLSEIGKLVVTFKDGNAQFGFGVDGETRFKYVGVAMPMRLT